MASHIEQLRDPTVRRIVLGGAISGYGDALQNAAQGWIAVQLTHSSRGVGLFALFWLLPRAIASLVSGVFVDRHRRSTVLKSAVLVGTVVAVAFFGFALAGALTFPRLLLLALGFALAGPFEISARNALLPSLVPRDRIPSVIALVFTVMYSSELLGLVTGGLVLAFGGVLGCVALNLVTYVVYLVLVWPVRSAPVARGRAPFWRVFAQGLRFVLGKQRAFVPLVIGALFAVLGFHFDRSTLPLFAVEDLHTSAFAYGLLLAAAPLGAVLIIGLSPPSTSQDLPQRIVASVLALSLCLASLALCVGPQIAFVVLLGLGAARGIHYNAIATQLQLKVPDVLRGRVLSYYNVASGLYGVGGMAMGWFAPTFGVPLGAHLRALHALPDPAGLRGVLFLAALATALGAAAILGPLRSLTRRPA